MESDPILNAAFIIAATAFFKEQLSLSGRASLLAAFGVSLAVGFAPAIAAQFPLLAPWVTHFVNVVVLFISAAGTVDALKQFHRSLIVNR